MASLFDRFFGATRSNAMNRPEEAREKEIAALLDLKAREIHEFDPDTAGRWQALQNALSAHPVMKRDHTPPVPFRPLRIILPVATVAIAAVIAMILWPHQPTERLYSTTKGQLTSIVLPDSSEVILNHTSRLTVDDRTFSRSREVSLVGEALFRVRKTGTPFTVNTGIARVRVVGTEFDVRIRNELLDVGVLTGKVNVSSRRDGRDSTVVVVGGERTTCARSGFPERPHGSAVDVAGWVSGRLSFSHAELWYVCEEIESTLDITIRVDNPVLRGETLTGTIDARNPVTALTTLARLTGSRYRDEHGTFILY